MDKKSLTSEQENLDGLARDRVSRAISNPENERYSNGVGPKLTAERRRQKLSLTDVANGLRIQKAHLLALEEGRIDDLPGHAYAIGFLRTYCKFLNLDDEGLVKDFKTQTGLTSPKQPLVILEPREEARRPGLRLILASSLVAIGFCFVWIFMEQRRILPIEVVTEPPARLMPHIAVIDEFPVTSTQENPNPALENSGPPPNLVKNSSNNVNFGVTNDLSTDKYLDHPDIKKGHEEVNRTIEAALDVGMDPVMIKPPTKEKLDPEQVLRDKNVGRRLNHKVGPDKEKKIECTFVVHRNDIGGGVLHGLSKINKHSVRVPAGDTKIELNSRKSKLVKPQKVPKIRVKLNISDPRNVHSKREKREKQSFVKVVTAEELALTNLTINLEQSEEVKQKAAILAALNTEEQLAKSLAAAPSSIIPKTGKNITDFSEIKSVNQLPLMTRNEIVNKYDASGIVKKRGRVVLRALNESWIQIQDSNNELLLARVLRAGHRYNAPNRSDLLLMTGNAGAIEVSVDGTILGALGSIGEVRRDIKLHAELLLLKMGNAVVSDP